MSGALRSSWNLPGRNSFSLVEVVLALALVAFAFAAILGSFAFEVKTSRSADEATRLGNVTNVLLSRYTAQTFTNLAAGTIYFSRDGIETNAAAAYYRCDVKDVTPATITGDPYGSNLTAVLRLRLIWPATATGTAARTNNMVTSAFNYE